jgi:hypothetical protein
MSLQNTPGAARGRAAKRKPVGRSGASSLHILAHPMTEPPKLIIDSDWKSQAQAEKEKLAAQERERAAKQPAAGVAGIPGAAGAAPTTPGDPEGLPEANFEELIRLLMGQALLYMGAFPDPETGRSYVSLEMARLALADGHRGPSASSSSRTCSPTPPIIWGGGSDFLREGRMHDGALRRQGHRLLPGRSRRGSTPRCRTSSSSRSRCGRRWRFHAILRHLLRQDRQRQHRSLSLPGQLALPRAAPLGLPRLPLHLLSRRHAPLGLDLPRPGRHKVVLPLQRLHARRRTPRLDRRTHHHGRRRHRTARRRARSLWSAAGSNDEGGTGTAIVVGAGLADRRRAARRPLLLVPVKRSTACAPRAASTPATRSRASRATASTSTSTRPSTAATSSPTSTPCSRWPTGPRKIIDLLDRMGVPFNRTSEGYRDLRLFGGSLFKRTHFAGATTGQQLLYALDEQSAATRARARSPSTSSGSSSGPSSKTPPMAAASASSPRTCGRCRSAPSAPTRSSWPPAGAGWSSARAPTRHLHRRRRRPLLPGRRVVRQPRDDPGPPDRDPRRRQAPPHERIARGEGGRVWVPRKKGDTAPPRDIPEAERYYFLEERYPASTATSSPATSPPARSSTSA